MKTLYAALVTTTLVLVFLCGCGRHAARSSSEVYEPRSKDYPIDVYREPSPAVLAPLVGIAPPGGPAGLDRPYTELGVVSVNITLSGSEVEDIEKLKRQARQLGGDALILERPSNVALGDPMFKSSLSAKVIRYRREEKGTSGTPER